MLWRIRGQKSDPRLSQEASWIASTESQVTRQLFVHHADDACFRCSYRDAQQIATGHDFITVRGGMARGNPCQGMAHHGFYGQDAAVVAAIKVWIAGGAWPKEVD